MEQQVKREPGAVTSETRQTTRRKLSFGRIVLVLLGAACIAGGLWMGTTKSGRDFAETAPQAAKTIITIKQDPDLLFDHVRSNRVNILLIGEDYNWKNAMVLNPRTGKKAPFHIIDTDSPPRSDTMIVVRRRARASA